MARYPHKSKKTTMAKAKKMITKKNKTKAKKNMDTFFFKSKVTAIITPTQGVNVSNYFYNSFTLDPTGAASAYINNAEFQLYRGLYDKFRVNSVRVTFTPKANVMDIGTNNNDNALNTTGDGLVHHVIDRDGPGPSNIARLSRYPSYRKTSLLKKFTRVYSVKYPTGVWIDCDNPAAFTMNKELGLSGGITIYAENILEDNYELFNEPWGSVVVEHNIVFQGKASGSLTSVYNDSNELVGVKLNYTNTLANVPQTPLTNLRGSLDTDTRTVKDLSGNVTEQPVTDSPSDI